MTSRLLLLLPALTILWVNLHGGFFVGIILLMTYALGAAAEELVHGTRDSAWIRARKYLFTAGACVVASLVNPYGYRLHIHVAQYLGSSFYFKRISEFQSADFHTFTAAYFETLLVLAIAAAAWHLGKGRLIQLLLLLSWAHLALFSVRNIPIFAVVSAPGIGLAMRDWLRLVDSRSPLDWRGKLAASLAELETELQVIASGREAKSVGIWRPVWLCSRWHCLFFTPVARKPCTLILTGIVSRRTRRLFSLRMTLSPLFDFTQAGNGVDI